MHTVSKITYVLHNGLGELIKYAPVRNKTLEFSFSPQICGKLRIGEATFSVADGLLTLKLSDIPDGIHSPELYTKEGIFLLEGFKKDALLVEPLPPDGEAIRRVKSRLYELELKCSSLEKRLNALDEAVKRPLNF